MERRTPAADGPLFESLQKTPSELRDACSPLAVATTVRGHGDAARCGNGTQRAPAPLHESNCRVHRRRNQSAPNLGQRGVLGPDGADFSNLLHTDAAMRPRSCRRARHLRLRGLRRGWWEHGLSSVDGALWTVVRPFRISVRAAVRLR